MARAHFEWHGVIWKPQVYFWRRLTDWHCSYLFWSYNMSQLIASLWVTNETIKWVWAYHIVSQNFFFFSSSITTYGSWLLTFDRFGITCNMTGYAIWVVDSSTTCIIGTWKWWIWFSIHCDKCPTSRVFLGIICWPNNWC